MADVPTTAPADESSEIPPVAHQANISTTGDAGSDEAGHGMGPYDYSP